MPGWDVLPSTLRRSPKKAQRTWVKAHDSAAEEYGDGRRAHQTAFATLKRTFEKVGDHWEPKDGSGPSDPRAAYGRGASDPDETEGGVDAYASKQHLYGVAKRLGVSGRSRMNKSQLVDAIRRANQRRTSKARSKS